MSSNVSGAVLKPEAWEWARQAPAGWVVAGAALILSAVLGYRLYKSRIPTGEGQTSSARSRKNLLGDISLARLAILLLMAAALLLLSEVLVAGFWSTAAHEIGFAVLVSSVIWVIFEAQLRQEADEAWDKRIEHATRNVFQAVLRKDLPKPLLDEANNLILNSSLIRLGFSVTYTVRDELVDMGCNQMECILVDAVMEFGMKNVSTDVVKWNSGLRLPNPVHAALKNKVKVYKFEVKKGAEDVGLDLDKAEVDFRHRLECGQMTAVSYDAGEVTLQPGETCTCVTRYTMAKEVEDSEVLQTLHPADGLRVTVFDQATDGRRSIFASAIHRRELETEAGGGGSSAQIFRIPGYLLPHQGVLIWWKRTLPSAPGQPLPVQKRGGNQGQNEEEAHA